jgi:release factor glutamine methyltransferase
MKQAPENRLVGEILGMSADYLAERGVDNAAHAAKLLMGRLLDCKPLALAMRMHEPLGETRLAAMRRGVKRVADGEPLQYVLGEWDFMGHRFKVDRRALIPRPETEGLVERALGCDSAWNREDPLVVDVGTGSGVIAISLALACSRVHVVALDAEVEALELAAENADMHGVRDRITFVLGDLPDAVDPESVHMIVANLPYIPTRTVETLPREIRDHEPRTALDGGPRGLSIITTVVQDAALALVPGGMLWLEIGEEQGEAVTALLLEAGFETPRVSPDLNGRSRYASARLPDLAIPPQEPLFPSAD